MSSSFPSPETITRVELPNGIIVLAYENHNSPAVILAGYLWAGGINESAEQAGLASFTAGMLMRGTQDHSFGQINEALESVGAQLGFQGGMHTVGFGGKALAEDLDLLLSFLASSLQRPTFPGEETERLRGQLLTGLQRRAHDTRQMARLGFDALLFPDHPYGRSVHGYEETISGMSTDDLASYYAGHYTPQGMVICVVGAVPADTAVDRVRAALGDWQAPGVTPNQNTPPPVSLAEKRRRVIPIEGKTQSDIVLGWPGLTRSDPDFTKARLANTLLGVFGMMGRLGDTVRDEEGLAYYVYSQLQAGLGAGPWVTFAGVNPANVERAIDGILRQVRRLRQEKVPEDELADSQSFLAGSMPLRLETNEGLANTILSMERYDLGFDYLARFGGMINAVTVEDVQEMAQKYLDPQRYALAVAGPGDGNAEEAEEQALRYARGQAPERGEG
jgi:zinc protease